MRFWKCVIYLGGTGFLGFLMGRVLPKRWFDHNRFWFRCREFEQEGKFYDRFFIRKWKDHLPDMSKLLPSMMPSKSPKAGRQTAEDVAENIRETCIAEVIHDLLGIVGFGCMWIWPGMGGVIMSLLCFFGNIPFVIAQRYNRPRFAKIYDRLRKTGE